MVDAYLYLMGIRRRLCAGLPSANVHSTHCMADWAY